MKFNEMEMSEKIKYFRKLRDMTQKELSEASGIELGQHKKYETGYRLPKIEQLQIIANALGISVQVLTGFEVKTAGDVMALLQKLETTAGLKISGRKNKDGSYRPSSIKMSFENEHLLEVIATYLQFKDSYADASDYLMEDANYTIQIEKTVFMCDETPLQA